MGRLAYACLVAEVLLPRRVLVLGGGSDIVAEFVQALAGRSLPSLELVVLAGRPGGSTDAAAAALAPVATQAGFAVHTAPFDAAATDSHAETLAALDQQYDGFDCIIAAFGDLGGAFTVDLDPAEAARLCQVNFSGGVSACLASLQVLRGNRNARLIVFSSLAAVRPRVGNLIYGASKAGLDAFAIELAAPARKLGVDVLVVRPGFVYTKMTEGLDAAPFSTTPDAVALDMIAAIEQGKTVVHSPRVLQPVGLVLKNLPGVVWRRVSAR